MIKLFLMTFLVLITPVKASTVNEYIATPNIYNMIGRCQFQDSITAVRDCGTSSGVNSNVLSMSYRNVFAELYVYYDTTTIYKKGKNYIATIRFSQEIPKIWFNNSNISISGYTTDENVSYILLNNTQIINGVWGTSISFNFEVLQDFNKILISLSNRDLDIYSNREQTSNYWRLKRYMFSGTPELQGLNISTSTAKTNQEMIQEQLDKQEELIRKQQEQNDFLQDDNITGATGSADGFFGDFEANNYGLSSIITAPLNLIQSITSKTCSPISLPLPFINQPIMLPCMTTIYSSMFGSVLTLYQTITTGLISYYVIVNIFSSVKGFQDPDKNEIEVIQL